MKVQTRQAQNIRVYTADEARQHKTQQERQDKRRDEGRDKLRQQAQDTNGQMIQVEQEKTLLWRYKNNSVCDVFVTLGGQKRGEGLKRPDVGPQAGSLRPMKNVNKIRDSLVVLWSLMTPCNSNVHSDSWGPVSSLLVPSINKTFPFQNVRICYPFPKIKDQKTKRRESKFQGCQTISMSVLTLRVLAIIAPLCGESVCRLSLLSQPVRLPNSTVG